MVMRHISFAYTLTINAKNLYVSMCVWCVLINHNCECGVYWSTRDIIIETSVNRLIHAYVFNIMFVHEDKMQSTLNYAMWENCFDMKAMRRHTIMDKHHTYT